MVKGWVQLCRVIQLVVGYLYGIFLEKFKTDTLAFFSFFPPSVTVSIVTWQPGTSWSWKTMTNISTQRSQTLDSRGLLDNKQGSLLKGEMRPFDYSICIVSLSGISILICTSTRGPSPAHFLPNGWHWRV